MNSVLQALLSKPAPPRRPREIYPLAGNRPEEIANGVVFEAAQTVENDAATDLRNRAFEVVQLMIDPVNQAIALFGVGWVCRPGGMFRSRNCEGGFAKAADRARRRSRPLNCCRLIRPLVSLGRGTCSNTAQAAAGYPG